MNKRKAPVPPRTDLVEIERRARRLRAEAIADLLSRFVRWIELAHEREVERYLSKAVDVADLERRIRDLQRSPGSGVFGSVR